MPVAGASLFTPNISSIIAFSQFIANFCQPEFFLVWIQPGKQFGGLWMLLCGRTRVLSGEQLAQFCGARLRGVCPQELVFKHLALSGLPTDIFE
ncbi:MAG: hypothetical protein AAF998_00845 [Bacteroidota bacterium]